MRTEDQQRRRKHTSEDVAGERLGLLPQIGLVDLADRKLPARLAGKMDEQPEVFAAQIRHGLVAALVAIGLDVMSELRVF